MKMGRVDATKAGLVRHAMLSLFIETRSEQVIHLNVTVRREAKLARFATVGKGTRRPSGVKEHHVCAVLAHNSQAQDRIGILVTLLVAVATAMTIATAAVTCRHSSL
jgi:hypothetical protein